MGRKKDTLRCVTNLGLIVLVAGAGLVTREMAEKHIRPVENRINVVMPFDGYPVRLKVDCKEGDTALLEVDMPRTRPFLPSRPLYDRFAQNRNVGQGDWVTAAIGACTDDHFIVAKRVTFNPAEISRVKFTQVKTSRGDVFGTTIAHRQENSQQVASVMRTDTSN